MEESIEQPQPNTNTNINTLLSDDCLRMVLTQLPLLEQIRLRPLVCSRWFHLLSDHFAGRRSLKVMDSYADLQRLARTKLEHNFDHFRRVSWRRRPDDYLIVDVTNESTESSLESKDQGRRLFQPDQCPLLPILFPNICILGLSGRGALGQRMPKLIQSWRHRLHTLILVSAPTEGGDNDALWHAISAATRLKHLRAINLFRCEIPAELSVLPNLHKLALMHYLSPLGPLLARLTNCSSLSLSWVYLSVSQLDRVLEQNPSLGENLEFLSLGFISVPADESTQSGVNRSCNARQVFHQICSRFPRIQTLDILFAEQIPLEELMPSLHLLTELRELWLYIGRHQIAKQQQQPSISIRSEWLSSLPRLRLLRSLYVEIGGLTPLETSTLIGWLFPSLTQLMLRAPDMDMGQAATGTGRGQQGEELQRLLWAQLPGLQVCRTQFV